MASRALPREKAARTASAAWPESDNAVGQSPACARSRPTSTGIHTRAEASAARLEDAQGRRGRQGRRPLVRCFRARRAALSVPATTVVTSADRVMLYLA
jgi:hypothetical protein